MTATSDRTTTADGLDRVLYELLECAHGARSADHPAYERRKMTLDEVRANRQTPTLRWYPVSPEVTAAMAEAADRAGWDITFRLRGFLGGSGTAITSPTDKRRRIDESDLHRLLGDAANEIDRLRSDGAARMPAVAEVEVAVISANLNDEIR